MGLPPIEVSISLCLYIGALIYAIYHAFQYGQSEFIFECASRYVLSDIIIHLCLISGIDIPENEDSFSTGWSWIGRKRDYYDFEWEPFVENTRKYVYWYTCHVLLSEIVRQLEPHVKYFFTIRNYSQAVTETSNNSLSLTESLFYSYSDRHIVRMD